MENDNMRSVYVEGSDHLICKMFMEEGWTIVSSHIEADLICLEGGADVNYLIYDYKNRGSSLPNHSKDIHTFGVMAIADVMVKPVVGICRGSQAMCVFMGGKLHQHIGMHANGPHSLTLNDGKTITVSSAHHQASIPDSDSIDYAINSDDGYTEVVKYVNGWVGYQPHPEYSGKGSEMRKHFFDMIEELMQDYGV